ncbi:phosphoglycerate dehydrogenase [Enterococcus massiliensis]|uniref:phosphoglycerate dehydrogenase n=1 Tax=Enterococcus massiliensis TaxID=1640685 RepID=UPI00065E5598|nr:phosphoglycerate dehydrogenase [Enterococcus massiliensis]
MSKIILSKRPFKPELIEQIHEIAPTYEFKTPGEEFSWDEVAVTIGWSEAWKEKLFPVKNLKWVQTISAGVDYLPLTLFEKNEIQVTNGSGIHAQAITDHILATLFMKLRGIDQAVANQKKKRWHPAETHYGYLSEQQILILGTGHIGQRLAETLSLLGAKPLGINTSGHPVTGFYKTFSMNDLFTQIQQADFVINILPLTDETYHLFNASFFKMMQSTAAFINVGRGASVDTSAITAALGTKEIAFAALDVFEEEPLPDNSPLWELPNVLITPHIAGMTPHFQKAFMGIFLENLKSYVKDGTLCRNEVALEKGY